MSWRTALLAFATIGAFALLVTFLIAEANPTYPDLPPGWKWVGPPA